MNRLGPTIAPQPVTDKLGAMQLCEKSFAGVPQLLADLQHLSEDHESADVVFLLDRDEEQIYAHKIILQARYSNNMNCFVDRSIKSQYFLIISII